MNYVFLLKVYGSFFGSFFIIYSIWVFIQNKEIKIKRQRLIRETRELNCLCFENIKVSNQVVSNQVFGRRNIGESIFDATNLYLFDDFLLIFRTQNFIIKRHFEPFGIAHNPLIIKQQYSLDEIYKPNNILFPSKTKKGNNEIRFFYNDLINPKDRIFFKVKGLSEEHVLQLQKVEKWV